MRPSHLLSLVVAAIVAPAHALTLITEENSPLNFTQGGRVVGYATEVVTEMGKRARIPLKFEVMPWAKGYVAAQAGRDNCIYAIARLENRENLFQWVGPIAFNRWAVYGRTDFTGTIRSLDDLKPQRLGAVTFDAKADYLKSKSIVNLLLVEDDRQNPPRLFLSKTDADHIDLWVTSLAGAKQTAGARANDLKLVYTIRDVPNFLACSPQVPREVVGKFAGALASMGKDGALEKIAGRYDRRF
jgi:polar amino acid transport system substrate-binding protein